MRFRVAPLLILTAHACCLGAPAEDAASLVQNPSFEDGGATIQGVGYVRQGNPIPGWEAGADGECARNPLGAAFFDNGATPDGAMIAVLQNRSTLRQEIGPFERDRVYRLRLRANGRAADETVSGKHGLLEVRLNDTQLIGPVEVKPVDVTATIRKVPSIMAIRVLRGMLFYNDGYKMRREKLIPGKPVTVRITQQ